MYHELAEDLGYWFSVLIKIMNCRPLWNTVIGMMTMITLLIIPIWSDALLKVGREGIPSTSFDHVSREIGRAHV